MPQRRRAAVARRDADDDDDAAVQVDQLQDSADGASDVDDKLGNSDDGDDYAEQSDEEDVGAAQARAGKPRGQSSKQGALTFDEVSEYRESEQLFSSHLIQLQMKELLSEVRMSPKALASVEKHLHALKSVLERLEPSTVTSRRLTLPLLLPGQSVPNDVVLSWTPPERVYVVGSYLVGTPMRGAAPSVDLAVQMDQLLPRDYKHNRYFIKRALWLAALATKLVPHLNDSASLSWDTLNGDPRKPILVWQPARSKLSVRLLPCIAETTWPLRHLHPDRSTVHVLGRKDGEATPHYSAAVLEDMMYEAHLRVMHRAVSVCPALQDAVLLLKVWLRAAHLPMRGFQLGFLAAALVLDGSASAQSSAYQLARKVMYRLAAVADGAQADAAGLTDSLTDRPVWRVPAADGDAATDGKSSKSHHHLPEDAEWRAHFPVTLVDESGVLNVLARVSANSWAQVTAQAASALAMLDRPGGFEAVFLTRQDPAMRYDALVSVLVPSQDAGEDDQDRYDTGVAQAESRVEARAQRLLQVMQQALGTRAVLVHRLGTTTGDATAARWPALPLAPPQLHGRVEFGLLLDAAEATRILDEGPASDDSERVREFRRFWGTRAATRRFRDGRIIEAVVWNTAAAAAAGGASSATSVLQEILHYILPRHVRVSALSVVASDVFAPLIPRATAATTARRAFDQLSKRVHALADLPLRVLLVQALDPVLRHTAVDVPLPHPHADGPANVKTAPRAVRPLEFMLQFESSGRWPDNPVAVAHAKAAFYVRLAQAMQKEHGVAAHATADYVDVPCCGFVFRGQIHHERDVALLAGTDAAAAAALQKQHEWRARHTKRMEAATSAFPALAAACSLVKRWLCSQMFSGMIAEEAVELMVLHLFTSPAPYSPPSSALPALLRWLYLVESHAWHAFPLLVETSATAPELSDSVRTEISSRYDKRPSDMRPRLYLATADDPESRQWTSVKNPSGPTMGRLQSLARVARRGILSAIEHALSAGSVEDAADAFLAVFRPNLAAFDVTLPIAMQHNVRAAAHTPLLPRHRGFQQRWQAAVAAAHDVPVYRNVSGAGSMRVAWDPVTKLVAQLRQRFGAFALFAYDECGGDVVGVTFIPSAVLPRAFRVAAATHTLPAFPSTHHPLLLNIHAILADMLAIGDGIITDACFS